MADKELREDLDALAKFWEDAMDGDSVFAYELRSVLAAHPPEPAVEYGTPPYTAKSTPPEPGDQIVEEIIAMQKADPETHPPEPAEGTGLVDALVVAKHALAEADNILSGDNSMIANAYSDVCNPPPEAARRSEKHYRCMSCHADILASDPICSCGGEVIEEP